MCRGVLAAVCALLVLTGAADAKKRRDSTQLLRLLSPAGRASVPAHPDVNLVVRFLGSAQPATFRARLAGRDITDAFTPMLENGKQVGARATIPRDRVRINRRRTNRLRVVVRGPDPGKGRAPRQIVRSRFRVVDAPNLPPVAVLDPESEVIFPNISLGFDASQSFDPEFDELTYTWDFGEGGAGASDVVASYTYESADEPRTVTLTVSDGQASSSARVTLRSCPQPDDATPGIIQVEADAALEFGAVAPGASATRTFTVRNLATEPASRLSACLGVEGDAFSVSPDRVEVGAQESATVTVTFAPTVEGHASAMFAVVSEAANRPVVSLVARGYGGSARGPGPLLASAPVFYTQLTRQFDGVKGFMPDGAAITLDTHVGLCASPDGGFGGSGNACVGDGNCLAGEVCPQSDLCREGARAGQVCTVNQDCPIERVIGAPTCAPTTFYACASANPIDPVELCGDGAGGLYLLSEDSYTPPDSEVIPDYEYPLAGTLYRVDVDADGNTTGRTILTRTTEDTTHLACDRFGSGAGGRVFLAETRGVPAVGDCFRDTREGLVAVRKSNGSSQTVMPRIDAAQGLSECDDIDNVTRLEVSADGSQAFASFDSNGLWRVRPSPLQFIDSSYFEEFFRVHPDGSVIFATARDGATQVTVNVFKVTPAQVAAGPLPVNGLLPCATFQLPNNRKAGRSNRSGIVGLAVGTPAAGSRDGIILVSVITPPLTAGEDVDPTERCPDEQHRIDNLTIRGTIAFSSAADATTCAPLGLVNLERADLLTF